MIKIITVFFIYMAVALCLMSCGGGGGGGANSHTTYTGQYIDAPVRGLSYAASPSGLVGTTDVNGNFHFQAGDTVIFNIVTPGGNIGVGSVTPVPPSSPSETVPVSVISLANGTQIAQILQTLGGTGSTIDVGNTNQNIAAINSGDAVAALNNFVSTTGSSNVSTILPNLIDPITAFGNAINSIGSINSSLSASLTELISGRNYYYYEAISNPSQSINGGGFTSVGSNVSTSTSGTPGALAVTGEKSITVTTENATKAVSFLYLDGREGIFNDTSILFGDLYTGVGIYKRILKSSEGGFSVGVALGNSTFRIGGLNVLCAQSTSQFKLRFNSAATGFSAFCGNDLLTAGTVVNNSYVSGVIELRSTFLGTVAIGLAHDAIFDTLTHRIISGTLAGSQLGVSFSSANLNQMLPVGPKLYDLKNCADYSCTQ